MRVLITVPWDQKRGGVTAVANNVARHLLRHGHDVVFFYPGDSTRAAERVTQNGFRGFDMRLRPPLIEDRRLRSLVAFWTFLPRTAWRLHRLLRSEQIDVVHIHYPSTALVYFAICGLFRRVPLVVSVHGAELMPGGKHLRRVPASLRWLLNRSDRVTAPSRDYMEAVLSRLPELREKSVYIHNAVDVAELRAGMDQNGGDDCYSLTIALHNEKKALDVLIRALPEARANGFLMPVLLVGGRPLEGTLRELAQSLGVDDQVRFLGYQELDAIRNLLQRCTLFILPSRSEPFGIAILEAMSLGKAVITTRVGGIPEFVVDGQNGVLVESDDPAALAAAMCRVSSDAELRRRLGLAARETVDDGYTAERMGERYLDVFESLDRSSR